MLLDLGDHAVMVWNLRVRVQEFVELRGRRQEGRTHPKEKHQSRHGAISYAPVTL